MFSCLTWLKVVLPRVRMGDRTCALLMTWIRNTSASRGRQSLRNARKIRFSPFWLKIRIPDSIVTAESRTRCAAPADRMGEETVGRRSGGLALSRMPGACGIVGGAALVKRQAVRPPHFGCTAHAQVWNL